MSAGAGCDGFRDSFARIATRPGGAFGLPSLSAGPPPHRYTVHHRDGTATDVDA
jgi:hypothetical protein